MKFFGPKPARTVQMAVKNYMLDPDGKIRSSGMINIPDTKVEGRFQEGGLWMPMQYFAISLSKEVPYAQAKEKEIAKYVEGEYPLDIIVREKGWVRMQGILYQYVPNTGEWTTEDGEYSDSPVGELHYIDGEEIWPVKNILIPRM